MKKISRIIFAVLIVCLLVCTVAFAEKTSGVCGDNMTWSYDADNGILTIDGTGNMWNYPVRFVEWRIGPYDDEEWILRPLYYEYDYEVTGYVEILVGGNDDKSRWVLWEVGRPAVQMYIGDEQNGKWELVYTDRPYEIVYAGDSNNGEWLVAYTDKPYELVYIGDEQNGKWEVLYTDYEYIIDTIGPNGDIWAAAPTVPWYGLDIETIVLTESVTDICMGPLVGYFYEVEDGNNAFYSDENGVLFTKDKSTLISCPTDFENKSYVVPAGVTTIEYCAFENIENLESIVMPDSVKRIGTNAFAGCTNLSSVEFPSHLDFLDFYAFDYTAWLENYPEGVIYAANFAIGYSYSEDYEDEPIELVVKEGTTHVADYAFCEMNIVSAELPEGLESIGDYAFNYCDGLETVVIPDSVRYIGESAFYNCPIQYVELPYGVETVGEYAFSVYDYIVLPETVTEVDVESLADSKLYVKNGSTAEAFVLEYNEDNTDCALEFGYYYDVMLDSTVSGRKATRAYKLDDRDLYVDETPECSGYIVKGWADSADADESECLTDNMYTENKDTTLYAVLEKADEVYTIDDIWLLDSDDNELDSIPEGEFLVSIEFSNVASYDNDSIAVSSYDSDGRFLGIVFAKADFQTGYCDIPIDNTGGKIDCLKVFIFDKISNMMPYAQACEIR